MRHTLESYLHIVNGEIQRINQSHPLEGNNDKTIFIKRFVRHFENMQYEDISDGQSKIYKIKYNGYEYNIFIEAFDGGGRDSTDGAKKISITSIKKFRELLDAGESVLIINEYCFLKRDPYGNINLDDTSVYGIIKPEEVYFSKTVRENTRNPSSRWVRLEDMIRSVQNQQIVTNGKDNVYIIPANLLSSYFDLKIINEDYEQMAKFIFKFEKDKKLSEEKITRLFRESLIKERGLECEFYNCKTNVSELLVASHINARANIRSDSTISDDEKFKLMTDVNNGFLLCRTHDSVFDKKLITISDSGQLIVSNVIKNYTKEFNLDGYENKKIIEINPDSLKYLHVHQEEFNNKNS